MPRRTPGSAIELKVVDGQAYKQCTWCKEYKLLSEFYVSLKNSMGLSPPCKECLSSYYKNRNTKEKNRKDNLDRYGLTIEKYDLMYAQQEGKCAICGIYKEVLDVDHCHKSNKVRKLLCNICNKGLGSFGDNIELMEKAISYLKEFGE